MDQLLVALLVGYSCGLFVVAMTAMFYVYLRNGSE